MSRGLRIFISAMAAAGVTFGLFLLMYHLIASDGADQQDYQDLSGINFGPVDVPEEVTRRDRRKPPPPPPPKEPPPPPKLEVSDPNPVQQNLPNLDMPKLVRTSPPRTPSRPSRRWSRCIPRRAASTSSSTSRLRAPRLASPR